MTKYVRLCAVLGILALTACAGDTQNTHEELDPRRDQEALVPPVWESGPASAQGVTPMPVLDTRIELVLEELDEEVGLVRLDSAPESNSHEARRERLAALSPRARASLRRHNVRLEQLSRVLQLLLARRAGHAEDGAEVPLPPPSEDDGAPLAPDDIALVT